MLSRLRLSLKNHRLSNWSRKTSLRLINSKTKAMNTSKSKIIKKPFHVISRHCDTHLLAITNFVQYYTLISPYASPKRMITKTQLNISRNPLIMYIFYNQGPDIHESSTKHRSCLRKDRQSRISFNSIQEDHRNQPKWHKISVKSEVAWKSSGIAQRKAEEGSVGRSQDHWKQHSRLLRTQFWQLQAKPIRQRRLQRFLQKLIFTISYPISSLSPLTSFHFSNLYTYYNNPMPILS